MVFILASTDLLTARIAAGCLAAALFVVLFVAKNVRTIYVACHHLCKQLVHFSFQNLDSPSVKRLKCAQSYFIFVCH